jgi:hypothetical protein
LVVNKPVADEKVIGGAESKACLKTTIDATRSIEASFLQLVLKDYLKNMTKSFKNVYERLSEVKDNG